MQRLKSYLSFAPLRTRLLLLVLLAVIPAWGLMFYSAGEQRRMATSALQEEALRMARIVAASEDRVIEGARQLLTTLAQLQVIRDADTAPCGALLAGLLKQYPNYANIGVVLPDGNVKCSALPFSSPLNIADRLYIRRALESREFAIGEYQIGRITRKASVNLGYPILDETGAVKVVVFAALDLGWLNQLAATTELPEGAVLSVIDRSGVILVRYPDPEAWVGKTLPEIQLIKTILAQGGEGIAEAADVDGMMRLYGFTSLSSGPGLNVFLSIGVPKRAVFAQVDHVFRRSMIGLAVVAALALVAAWVGGNAFILRQVNALVGATRRVAAGDLSVRTGMRGLGELNQLAQAFDEMTATLQKREAEARRSAEEIKLLQTMTLAISAAEDLHAALAIAVKKICETTGWSIGQAWTPSRDGRKLECSPGWYAGVEGLEDFHHASIGFTFEPDKGLPGRAWSRKAPVWIKDVTEDPNFPRASFAAAVGIKAGLAVPVLANGEVVALMEFFMLEPRSEDARERSIQLVAALASQLGTVIERKRADDRVRYLAYFDALTDLPNRAQLQESLQKLISDAKSNHRPLALLILALERFKEINYTLGQANADLLLQQIGPRIREALHEADTLFYFGGRRFAVLLPGSGAHSAAETSIRVLKGFEQPFAIAGFTVEVGANIGIAVFPGHGEDAAVLTRHAEVALYIAQQSGSDYTLYNAEHDFYNPRRLQLMGELRSAIAERQLILYCQPKLDLKSGEIVAMEGLMRWRHPSYGLMSPDAFVPLIESTGLIGPVTQWVLDAALIQCSTWQQSNMRVPVAVNLSTRNLADPKLIDRICNALSTWGAEASWIDLEITESAIMVDPAVALEALNRLSSMGFRLFIDDFGTGYSSLAYLQKLPVSAIKIDKSFVQPLLEDQDAEVIVRSTIELGHNLGLKVVAEGVESQEICHRLASLGCDEAQGYYVSRPLPADQFVTWANAAPWPLRTVRPQ